MPKSQLPSRASLEKLALREPVLASALAAHRRGRMTYEQALRVAIIAVCDHSAALRKGIAQREHQQREDARPGAVRIPREPIVELQPAEMAAPA